MSKKAFNIEEVDQAVNLMKLLLLTTNSLPIFLD
jgi:hypothetical protein